MRKTSFLILFLLISSQAFADKVIIHSSTRVIKVVTSDANPTIPANHEAVTVPNGFDLAGGPYKLDIDNLTKLVPSDAELKDAYRTQRDIDRADLKAKLVAFSDDVTTGAKIKAFLTALDVYFNLDQDVQIPS